MPQGLHWIVTPTYGMAEDIYWQNAFTKLLQSPFVKSVNKTKHEVVLVNDSIIALRSAENPERLVGVPLRSLVVDEVAKVRNWSMVWDKSLRPTLTDYKAPALFISTPQGYNHYYDLFCKQDIDEDYESFKYTSYDNPYISSDEIDKAKSELDEDSFNQEYMAEFKKFTGLVYKDFSREKHVIEPIELQSDWTYYRGIDFGFIHPTATVFCAVDKDGILYLFDSIYKTQLNTPDLALLIKQKSAGQLYTMTVGDSAQASDIAELNKYGISVRPVSKTSGTGVDWMTYRIRRVTELLREGKIKIFSNNIAVIDEFESYQYYEANRDGYIREVPMKMNDHALDALSYVVVNIPQKQTSTLAPTQATEWARQLPVESYHYF